MTTPLATADRAFSVSIQSADFDIRAEQAALTHARGISVRW
ncbi:hypothetical protein ACU8V3_00555 [Cobetia marina]